VHQINNYDKIKLSIDHKSIEAKSIIYEIIKKKNHLEGINLTKTKKKHSNNNANSKIIISHDTPKPFQI
jgi:hypothetical protein